RRRVRRGAEHAEPRAQGAAGHGGAGAAIGEATGPDGGLQPVPDRCRGGGVEVEGELVEADPAERSLEPAPCRRWQGDGLPWPEADGPVVEGEADRPV